MRTRLLALLLVLAALFVTGHGYAAAVPAKVIFDTDIGDDIDDAYALALLLQSPEVRILGVTTAFGDTHLRARLASRFLQDAGHGEIPVFAGPVTKVKNGLTQADWARKYPDRSYPDAIDFMLRTIHANPGEITLIAVAPFTNVGALIAKDPATFRELKRVVIMGGSVNRGYGDPDSKHPEPEWNILCDIPAAKALFTSGVPLYVMPLDSTQIPLDASMRKKIFDRGTPLTNDLRALTAQWSAASDPHQDSPTLFDAVAAAYALHPEVCPTTPMRLAVDDEGRTVRVAGTPNANVCLNSDPHTFFDYYLPRVTK